MSASDRAVLGARWRPSESLRAPTTREILVIASLASVVVGAAVLQTPYLTLGALIWFGGLTLLVGSFWHRSTLASLTDLAVTRAEGATLTATLVLAAFLRFWSLENLPTGFHIDEAVMGLIARDILQGRGPHPFGFAFIDDPAPLMYAKAAFLVLFGDTFAPMRWLAALSGFGGVVALWLLARPLYGRGVALLATALLAATASHILFSRLAISIIEIPFLGVLAVALVWRGLRTNQAVWHLLGGIALGFAQYANFGARAFVLAVGGLYAVMLLHRWRDWAPLVLGGVATGVGMLAVMLPQLLFVRDAPNQLFDRLRYRSVFRRWDQATDIHQTDSPVGVMIGQAVVNVRAFLDMPDRGPFYEFTNEPLLYGPVAATFLVGTGVALWRARDPRYTTPLLVCAGVLLAGILSAGAPQFHRLVPMVPVACLLAAIGTFGLAEPLGRVVARLLPALRGVPVVVLPVLLVALTTFDGFSGLFVRQPAGMPWQPHSAWARWVGTQPPDLPVYIAGAPDVRAWDERIRFFADERPLADMPNPTLTLPAMLSHEGPAVIALSPRLPDWLPLFQEQLPDATFVPVLGPDEKVTLIAVSIPAAPRAAPGTGGLRGEVTIDGDEAAGARTRFDPALVFREASRLGDDRPFRARWSGSLLVRDAGSLRLELFTDGAAELIVDGDMVIDGRTAPSPRSVRSDVKLTPGSHTIVVTYSYLRGPGTLELRWQRPGGKRSLIPPSALRPD